MTPPRLAPSFAAALFTLAVSVSGCGTGEHAEGTTTISRADLDAWRADHVVVTISRSNHVKVDGASIRAGADLAARLAAAGKATPGRPVILLLQDGTAPQAADFVRRESAKAGLGRVELR